jgi:hypothetical protein
MPQTKAVDQPKLAESKVPPSIARPAQPEAMTSLASALARVYWMLAGNAALGLVAIGIVQYGRARTWVTDATFWAIFVSLLVVRYVDITRLQGATASGEPASVDNWYRYAGGLFLISLLVWILAHTVARILR